MHGGRIPASDSGAIFPAAEQRRKLPIAAASCRKPKSDWDFTKMAAKLWPQKTASHIHFITEAAERTCRAWASGETRPPSETLVALLRSAEGSRVLAHVMRGSTQPWWRDYQAGQICLAAKLRADAEIQQLELGI